MGKDPSRQTRAQTPSGKQWQDEVNARGHQDRGAVRDHQDRGEARGAQEGQEWRATSLLDSAQLSWGCIWTIQGQTVSAQHPRGQSSDRRSQRQCFRIQENAPEPTREAVSDQC